MTIIGVGKPVPSQLYLMQLGGLVIDGRRRVENPTKAQVESSQQDGLEMLKRLTGQYFGNDILQWFSYLAQNSEKYGITHPYGYANMRKFLKSVGYNLPWKKDLEINR